MVRALLFFLLTCFGITAHAQQIYSDHGTPLIPLVPCDCNNWHPSYNKVDSTVQKLYELPFEKNGLNYRRIYFATFYDTTWYDVCDEPATCKGANRNRVTIGDRVWYVDSADCNLISFTLPCCSDKKIVVKDVGQVKFIGKCEPTYIPETIDIPALLAWSTETATVTAGGKTLSANILMVNGDIKIAAKADPKLEKLTKLNDLAKDKFAPIMKRTNDLLNKYLGAIGTWKSEIKLGFSFGGEASKICCVTEKECVKTSYKVFGEGSAGLIGTCGIPVTGLPVIGKYLGGIDVVVTLGAGVSLNVNGKTTCTSVEICATGEGKVTGGGGFGFNVAGFTAQGQVLVDGGLSAEVCFFPEFNVKCVKGSFGPLKLVGTVEDKWGWASWAVEYTVWNGFSAPLYGCQ